ncbi:RNA pyrophosphohydrolase [Rhodospirillaceae bacterium SYSU D60014]|uniref:RNA pyrophosphohydrolase n=1 Tax=Virgifigura deserti TaxID=2268457 RepID=UPI000E662645
MNAPLPSPENIAQLPYRRGVGIMMLNRQGQVFVARRIDTSTEAWQMPQGGIDGDETPEVAARRELLEETGTDHVELLGESRNWLRYDLPLDLVPLVWGGCFRGQEQKWFLFRFTGEDSDIDINTAQPEFADWRWIEIEELPRLIVPFKQQLYLDLVDEFRYLVGQYRKET